MKLIYLTTNPLKVREANHHLKQKYGFDLQIVNPDFDILEIQANSCSEVASFSVKYAADKLGYACLKSDTGLYIDELGGLPGPYNAYFAKQIGTEKFLNMLKNATNRKARLEHCFAYCEPNKEPIMFSGGSEGSIAYEPKGKDGRWHDLFFIPNGEEKTLAELRDIDYEYESKFWGTAIDDFAKWYKQTVLKK